MPTDVIVNGRGTFWHRHGGNNSFHQASEIHVNNISAHRYADAETPTWLIHGQLHLPYRPNATEEARYREVIDQERTQVRLNRQHHAVHRHRVNWNWHFPWETHTTRMNGDWHTSQRAAEPIWIQPNNANFQQRYQYQQALLGIRPPGWTDGRESASVVRPRRINAIPVYRSSDPFPSEPYFAPVRASSDAIGESVRRAFSIGADRRAVGLEPVSLPTNVQSIDQRGFGVEIECVTNTSQLAEAMTALGVSYQEESYNHTTRTYWKLITDGSVRYNGRRVGLTAQELVSPILSGDEGLRQLKSVSHALTTAGTIINQTCGLHVHHDVREMNIAAARVLAHNYFNATQALDQLVSPSRRANGNNTYCNPIDRYDVQRIDSASDLRDYSLHYNRYRTINFNAYSKYKTVEIRHHQGTFEYKKIHAWVMLMKHFIDVSFKGIEIPLNTSLENMLDLLDLPEGITSYYCERALALAAPANQER